MSINLGSNPFGLYLGSTKIDSAYVGSVKVFSSVPALLPAKTMRFKFENTSYMPTTGSNTSSNTSKVGTWTAVDASNGIWDWYYNNSDWSNSYSGSSRGSKIFHYGITSKYDIIDGNLEGVTTIKGLFAGYASTDPFIPLKSIKVRNLNSLPNTLSSTLNAFYCTSNLSLINIEGKLNNDIALYFLGSYNSALRKVIINLDCNNHSIDISSIFGHNDLLRTINIPNALKLSSADTAFAYNSSLSSIDIGNMDFSSVTTVSTLFYNCNSLEYLSSSIDLSNCTMFANAFCGCTSLLEIPDITVGKVTNCNLTFYNCVKVADGITRMYNRLNGQSTIPNSHGSTFKNCGTNSTTGSAQLANIPSGWK